MRTALPAFVAAAFLISGSVAAAAELEVIALRHRSVEQVLPVLRPLLEPGGTLTGMRDQLIMRTSPANLAELRRVLAGIDTPARRLLISVRHSSAASGARSAAQVSGRAEVGPGGASGGVTAAAVDVRATDEGDISQRVQVLEGSPAMIHVGSAVPVPSRVVTPVPGGAVVSDGLAYREAGTGFEVVARVAGERVTLDIVPRQESLGPGGSMGSQRVATTASGRLGEWFELGGVATLQSGARSGALARATETRTSQRTVWVRVDDLDRPAR